MSKANKKPDKKLSASKKKSTKSPILAKDKARRSQQTEQNAKAPDESQASLQEPQTTGKTHEQQQPTEDFFDDDASAISQDSLINQVEALVFSSSIPLSLDKIMQSLADSKPTLGEVRECLETLKQIYQTRGVHLVEVASGWRFQVAQTCAPTIVKTLVEKPSRLSRALLETLALIAYRQPITRAEIEAIRGVVVSTHMVKTLLDHEWIRVVGHKDVPGKPALYATTKTFLDDMGLKKLDELPPLSEIKSMISQDQPSDQSPAVQSLDEISDLMEQESSVEDLNAEPEALSEKLSEEGAEAIRFEEEAILEEAEILVEADLEAEEPTTLEAVQEANQETIQESALVSVAENVSDEMTEAKEDKEDDLESSTIDALIDDIRNETQAQKETAQQVAEDEFSENDF